MTAPMMDPAAMLPTTPAPQPPVLPPLPNPFAPWPCDNEPQIAVIIQKRLAKLFVDPKFQALQGQFPEWAQLAIDRYNAVSMALQPPPVVPRGVSIVDKVTGGDIGAEEAAAASGKPAQPGQPQQPEKPPVAHIGQQPTQQRGSRPL